MAYIEQATLTVTINKLVKGQPNPEDTTAEISEYLDEEQLAAIEEVIQEMVGSQATIEIA